MTVYYLRWGKNLRHNISQDSLPKGKHQAVTLLLSSFAKRMDAARLPVDHVELLLDCSELHQYWEFEAGADVNSEHPLLQPYSICVRLANRQLSNYQLFHSYWDIKKEHVACYDLLEEERFIDRVQDTRIFVSSLCSHHDSQPGVAIQKACEVASIGLWTRTSLEDSVSERLSGILVGNNPVQIPLLIHSRRKSSYSTSIWRDVVLLFEPNLSEFKFSSNDLNGEHQKKINRLL